MKIVLASASPRRKEILQNLGIEFSVKVADTDETTTLTNPVEVAETLSALKAKAVWDTVKGEDTLVIGCDTVVCCDGAVLGKPHDREDAKRILKMLSGREHTVTSGLTVIINSGIYTSHETTRVCFDELSEQEIEAYVATGECDDKAGAYAVQGLAARFIRGINGCYFNVVGLPVNLLYRTLKDLNIE